MNSLTFNERYALSTTPDVGLNVNALGANCIIALLINDSTRYFSQAVVLYTMHSVPQAAELCSHIVMYAVQGGPEKICLSIIAMTSSNANQLS